LVPSAYASWQLRPDIWVGLSVNAPFGLSVNFPNVWAGRNYAADTSLKTYNFTPSVAVRVNNWLSVGAGVQIMYATAGLTTGLPLFLTTATIDGHGWAFGATAGITITPGPNTTIGLGWRSGLNLDIDGSLSLSSPLPASTPGSVSTTVKLPDTVTLGVRQKVNDQFTLMGTIEWANWSRIGTSAVNGAAGPALILGAPVTLPFEYSDGWFFSLGGEYAYSDKLTLRAGIGYEISPITDRVRTPRLPDNDRIWTSVGLSYQAFANLWVDLAYTHIFVDDTPIAVGPGNPWFNGVIVYNGTVNSSVDIVSLGLRYRFNPPPPALITK